MRKDLLATVTAVGSATFLAGWGTSALAAPPAVHNWAGPYVGGSVGLEAQGNPFAFAYPNGGSDDIQFSGSQPFRTGTYGDPPSSYNYFGSLPTSGVPYAPLIGTVSGGFNYQTGAVVFGLEADASLLAPAKYKYADSSVDPYEVFETSGGMQSLFTLRPRIGVAIDKLLLYGTGGLAMGNATFDSSLHLSGDSGKGISTADWSGSNSAWKTGFTVGGGAEYAVNDKLSLKFEALYYNLGSLDLTANGSGVAYEGGSLSATPYTAHMDLQGTIARVGLTFHLQ